MTHHEYTLEGLQAKCSQSVSITYNCDAADTLSLAFKPEVYAELGITAGDRITIMHDGWTVFSGTLQTGPTHTVQAGGGEDIQVTAVSDLGLLERMAFVMENSEGNAVYPFNTEKWMEAGEYCSTIFNRMANWKGSPITTLFGSYVNDRVPTPEGNGATTAASLMTEALQWVPDAVIIQRYDPNKLTLTKSTALEPLSLPENAPIQSIGLTGRHDLIPPVCALVGGDNYKIPSNVDVRTPGAFIFPVPVDRDDNMRAGASPASQKMVVRGVPLPERLELTRGAKEYQYSPITEGSRTLSFLSRFFPQYKPLLGACEVGAAVLSVVTKEQLRAEAEAEAEANGDKDAQPVPANYSDTPQNWAMGTGGNGIYVLTEGSFPASYRANRNLRGLEWCKGSVTLMLRLPFDQRNAVPPALLEAVPTLFPGKARYWDADMKKYRSAWFVRLTVEAVFVNKRLRIFDAATAKPCSSDAMYNAAEDDVPTSTDYRAALESYYNATHTPDGQPIVPYEGSVSLLFYANMEPWDWTGRPLIIQGKRPEWETMNAVVRSVTWDFESKKLSLDVGSRAVLDFDEYLARRMLAKENRIRESQRLVVPFDVSDKEAKKEKEDSMSVSPSVSASASSSATAIHRKPFTLYEVVTGEGEDAQSVLWLAGGTLWKGGKAYNVPDSDKQFSKGQPGESGWTWGFKVKLKWEADENGTPAYTIYQDYT